LAKTWFIVSKKAAEMGGTSANLLEHQRLSIIDLLYALMLPSGNDAAVTLAENF
jgi:serine-type D-Ala-D-Ala carboxypeptidase (penicillin-binding protein 5/6)